MGFASPLLLLLLLALLIPVWLLRRGDQKAKSALAELGSSIPGSRNSLLRPALCVGFLASLIIVAAQPYVEPRRTGDYLFLVDTSRSMGARASCTDLTFLDRSKNVMRSVLENVPEARFGIVAFDRLAFPITQLTYDHEWLNEVITDALFIGMSYRATDTKLENALSVIADKTAELPSIYGEVRYVILISDGNLGHENWRETLREPLKRLQQEDLKVLAVGIGNDIETAIPLNDEQGNCVAELAQMDGRTVRVERRSDVLKFTADHSSGRYFGEGDTQELVRYIKDKTLSNVKRAANFTQVQRKELAWVFLLSATIALFGLLLL